MNMVFECECMGGRASMKDSLASIWSSSVKENTQTTTVSQQRQGKQSTSEGRERRLGLSLLMG